ncbi:MULTISPECIES: type II toxin-antitoxin system HicB family antitoxin [unclassified Bradyrhizobium]|uniref:type II toxin-antitoxin system HicB family antitoxin n=1 Tax=unclassified Bradyrhizobium TaxID=2631580 RepID=UPI0028EF5150|nr:MULTISPECIES: type II toxin-antitoxin system HicB family antitoxin [unclassified Bradyrhizobium]
MSDSRVYAYEVTALGAEDGGGFLVTFPDIPGVIGIGAHAEEAVADGQQALLACLDALKAVDRGPPVPAAARATVPLA